MAGIIYTTLAIVIPTSNNVFGLIILNTIYNCNEVNTEYIDFNLYDNLMIEVYISEVNGIIY